MSQRGKKSSKVKQVAVTLILVSAPGFFAGPAWQAAYEGFASLLIFFVYHIILLFLGSFGLFSYYHLMSIKNVERLLAEEGMGRRETAFARSGGEGVETSGSGALIGMIVGGMVGMIAGMIIESVVGSIYFIFIRMFVIIFFGTVATSVGEALEQLKWSKKA
ncbi:MAG: hypothetical protein ACTSYM_08575 [Candidatus Baldrarchaeia archaeon]